MTDHLAPHPAASLWPLMVEDSPEFLALVESMRKGFDSRFPVLRYQGQVLDGRNRLRAAEIAGVSPLFEDLPSDSDPWASSQRYNGARRHLPPDQRTAIVAELLRGSGEWQREREERAARANQARAEKAEGRAWAPKGERREPAVQQQGAVSRDTGLAGTEKTPKKAEEPVADSCNPARERDVLAKLSGTSPATAARVLEVQAKAPERMPDLVAGTASAASIIRELKSGNEPTKPRSGRPRSPGSDELDADVERLYQNHTVIEIAAKLGLKPRQVQTSVNRQGLKKGKGRRRSSPLDPILRGVEQWMTILDLWVDSEDARLRRRGAAGDEYDEAIVGLQRVRNRVAALIRVLEKERPCPESN